MVPKFIPSRNSDDYVEHRGDPRLAVPMHLTEVDVFKVKMHPANFLSAGEYETADGGGRRIVVQMGLAQDCPCGCGGPTNGTFFLASTKEAEMFARQLFQIVAEHEAAASAQATAALKKAAGK